MANDPAWIYCPDFIVETTMDQVPEQMLRLLRRGIPEEAMIVMQQQSLWDEDDCSAS